MAFVCYYRILDLQTFIACRRNVSIVISEHPQSQRIATVCLRHRQSSYLTCSVTDGRRAPRPAPSQTGVVYSDLLRHSRASCRLTCSVTIGRRALWPAPPYEHRRVAHLCYFYLVNYIADNCFRWSFFFKLIFLCFVIICVAKFCVCCRLEFALNSIYLFKVICIFNAASLF